MEVDVTAVLSREELKKKREQYIVPGVKQLFSDPPNLVKGKGVYLYDEKGKEYLDMFAGIVTVSVGHCHPKVTARTIEQLQTLQHTSTVFMTQPMVDLAEKLAQITPGDLSKTFVTNSGTEANEAAIRMARLASGRHEVIALITPPDAYFGEVKKILEQYGVLFIADEVQTGVGRTGNHWFGITNWGVQPDFITMAKGLANGLPIGAFITTPEIANHGQKQQINTFGGNPVSSATALAVLETIEEEKLMQNAKVVGEYLMEGLRDLQKTYPQVADVRGKGLMVGAELADEHKNPLTKEAARIVDLAKDDGVILGKGGLYGNTIRVKPPLNISKENVDTMLKSLRKALEATVKVPVS
ncbi:MAG: aspartate aminotransferase family protein [Candidatus Melainabacteria bacterium]|nr:aspartate aminotransferase family protein [Candidatus Melainabacteria bacterium]